MNTDSPLVCNMGVFTPEQRDSHISNTMQLFQAVQSVQEVENGYKFAFPGETEIIFKMAEFIANERLCCPFLKFTLQVPPNREQLSLTLTGPLGTQEFLRVEFDGVFS